MGRELARMWSVRIGTVASTAARRPVRQPAMPAGHVEASRARHDLAAEVRSVAVPSPGALRA
jgi:hypothetical protein